MKRDRKRYVRFRLHTDSGETEFDDKRITIAIRRNLLSLYGEIVLADSKFFLNEFNSETGLGILQCTLPTLEFVIASTSLIGKIDDVAVSFQPLKTSGTLKGLR